jgi:hypothetical protein
MTTTVGHSTVTRATFEQLPTERSAKSPAFAGTYAFVVVLRTEFTALRF